jgi:hypothetical protein
MIISYLKYRIKAQGKYHLHSPLVFDLYEKVLEPCCRDAACHVRTANSFYDDLDDRLTGFISDNPLIFKDEDAVMIVKDIHRSRKNEADWEALIKRDNVRLSIDCWRFGIVFVMDRIEKEHYILKV